MEVYQNVIAEKTCLSRKRIGYGKHCRDKCQRAEKATNLGLPHCSSGQLCSHIQEQLIAPLERNGWQVCHMDMKAEDGVDVIADVSDPGMATRFKDQFTLTICAPICWNM